MDTKCSAILRLFFISIISRPSFSLESSRELLLSKDPSDWPGHLEPFGSKQPTKDVHQLNKWPDPVTFFKDYVDKSKPVLLKGLAKNSPGYTKFSDNYFKSAPDAEKIMIYAEPEIKENRTKKGFTISIKEFIDRYHEETLYMVNALPSQFCSDVLMPEPLRCSNTHSLIISQVTWMSSGGTKSVLHNDDVDNINCLFRGSKELWMIEYTKNKMFVPIDQVKGGYSSLDVEKVNYTKYPELRKVDVYHHVLMEEGDCLFIPYHWFHQVNSLANEDKMNLAVNIWFKHEVGHSPEKCPESDAEATLNKYNFIDDEEESSEDVSMVEHFSSYLKVKDHITFTYFLHIVKKDKLVNPTGLKVKGFPDKLEIICIKLFNALDINKDGQISNNDFKDVEYLDLEKVEVIEDNFSTHVAELENYFEDLVDEEKKLKVLMKGEHEGKRIKDEF